MTVDVTLLVGLKGVDLVASTAFLTLVNKMGYQGKLLGLGRAEIYQFSLAGEDPEQATTALRRVLSTQSTFYNRNKHNYFLECLWKGGRFEDGVDRKSFLTPLENQAIESLQVKVSKDFDGKQVSSRGILGDHSVFQTEVLVEDLEPESKKALGQKLGSELGYSVEVTVLGTLWFLATESDNEAGHRALAEEIVLTERRHRGLLVNPNFQGYRLLSQEKMKFPSNDG